MCFYPLTKVREYANTQFDSDGSCATFVPSSSNALIPVVQSATCVRDPLSCIDNVPVKLNAIGPSSTISSVLSTDKGASQDMKIAAAHEIADVNMDDRFFKASNNTRPIEWSIITNTKPHITPIVFRKCTVNIANLNITKKKESYEGYRVRNRRW